ncbi:MAG: monovalent cation/H(+) antiporter subunit G [Peptococcaceae bacterium]|nr:monovalent cation/H(+) antiporter subunit G [Peptococcaceae bacterium]
MMFGLAWNEIIAVILLVGSLFFFLASAIGMIRLPDFYSRLHASGNSETMGLMLACLGLVFYEGPTLTAIKIVIIFLLVFLANPIGTHVLGKAALKSGHPITPVDKEEE